MKGRLPLVLAAVLGAVLAFSREEPTQPQPPAPVVQVQPVGEEASHGVG